MPDQPTLPVQPLSLAFRRDVVLRALRYAAIVGTILVAINHGAALIAGEAASGHLFQIALTYCVPYADTTFASVQAIKGEAMKQSGRSVLQPPDSADQ